jgi:RNA polymerase sigma-70 factor (ECF subfamily)
MDRKAYDALWSRHLDRLVLYGATLTGDRAAAEDAAQAVFLRLLNGGRLPDPATEKSYLFQALRNEISNQRRSRNRAEHAYRGLFKVAVPSPVEHAELTEFGLQVQAALQDLREDEREAVVLKTWGDLSFPEGAAVSGVSEKTFEHRYYRGLDALREKLGVRDEHA